MFQQRTLAVDFLDDGALGTATCFYDCLSVQALIETASWPKFARFDDQRLGASSVEAKKTPLQNGKFSQRPHSPTDQTDQFFAQP